MGSSFIEDIVHFSLPGLYFQELLLSLIEFYERIICLIFLGLTTDGSLFYLPEKIVIVNSKTVKYVSIAGGASYVKQYTTS